MDLSNSTVKTPDAETETPNRVQPAKPHPFSNGVLKRHAPLNLHHHPVVVAFRECMKNHAASLGGHAVDGCGEFMPTPVPNPADPAALKCAACGCHRNFHRREPEDPLLPTPPNAVPTFEYHPLHRHHPPPPPPPGTSDGSSPNNSPSPPPISSAYYPSAPHMLLALSHGGLAAAPPDGSTPISAIAATNSNSRKRFRTKFTQIQKEKMLEFAEKVGWKLQKRDEAAINEFCAEIGVEKGVLKVWMHNNKSTMGKKDNQIATANPPPPATTNGEINYSATATAAAAAEDQFPETDDSKDNANELELSDNNDDSILGTANGSSSS